METGTTVHGGQVRKTGDISASEMNTVMVFENPPEIIPGVNMSAADRLRSAHEMRVRSRRSLCTPIWHSDIDHGGGVGGCTSDGTRPRTSDGTRPRALLTGPGPTRYELPGPGLHSHESSGYQDREAGAFTDTALRMVEGPDVHAHQRRAAEYRGTTHAVFSIRPNLHTRYYSRYEYCSSCTSTSTSTSTVRCWKVILTAFQAGA